jgi:maleylpyruvate isomerase
LSTICLTVVKALSTFRAVGRATERPTGQPVARGQLDTRLAWMESGSRFFAAQARGLRDDELTAPSALPGWTRAHVIAHVARNADALGNLVAWARTGIETQMYESREQRSADIEEAATQSAPVLRLDLDDAVHRLAVAVASLPSGAWQAEVRTGRGRTIAAAEVPWMRAREVWVHAVDLDAGGSFADFPPDFVAAFLTELAAELSERPDCAAIELVAADTGGRFTIGPHSAGEIVVQGEAPALLAWLLGRDDGSTLTSSAREGLPAIPAWL